MHTLNLLNINKYYVLYLSLINLIKYLKVNTHIYRVKKYMVQILNSQKLSRIFSKNNIIS